MYVLVNKARANQAVAAVDYLHLREAVRRDVLFDAADSVKGD
jgi:hypothetical protein